MKALVWTMLLLVRTWLALVMDAGLPARASPIPLPVCVTLAENVAIHRAAAPRGATTGMVEGLAAARMLRYINARVARRLQGEALVFTYLPGPQAAIVHVLGFGCILPVRLTLDSAAFIGAVRAAFVQSETSGLTIKM